MKKNCKKFVYKKRPGVSLLISLILVGILFLFGLLITNLVFSAVRDSANVNRASEAYYAAEGALEDGLLENQKHGAGYSTKDPVPVNELQAGNMKAGYKISGQVDVPFANDDYGIPTPGTGDAVKDCDNLNPYVGGPFYYSPDLEPHYADALDPNGEYTGPYPAKDHPCNWNKISVGQTVTVPLYYFDVNDAAVNIFTAQNQKLELYLRTPCEDGSEMCQNAVIDRWTLDKDHGDQVYQGNDPIVSWQVVGEDKLTGKSLTLGPRVVFDDGIFKPISSTIISELKINSARPQAPPAPSNYNVLLQSSTGQDLNKCIGPLISFLINSDNLVIGCQWSTQTIDKPVFKFTVIHKLDYDQQTSVPYLEYQIVIKAGEIKPVDVAQTITAEGLSGSFKQVLQVKKAQESGILEYVIQQ